jgi:hypothetical protein
MGAGLSAPSVYIGQRVPPELAAYYAPDTVVEVTVYRNPPNTYYWTAFIVPEGGDPYVSVGVHGLNLSDAPYTRETYRVVLGAGAGGNTGLIVGDQGTGAGSVGAGGAGSLTYVEFVSGAKAQFDAGSIVTMSGQQINGSWISYTPSLSGVALGSGGGAGTMSAFYKYLGDHTVITRGSIKLGTASTTTGDWNIGLPVTPFVAPSPIGAGYCNQASTGKSWPTVIAPFGTIMFGVALTNNVGPANPFAWAANDSFNWTFTYEV